MDYSYFQTPCVFYLTLDQELPRAFSTFDLYLKELGFILVPVHIDQLQMLLASTEQEHVVVIASTGSLHEYKLYNQKIRTPLRFILKSKRLSFIHLSSFAGLNDQKSYALEKNYFFMKLPLDAKTLCVKISGHFFHKNQNQLLWPGGWRSNLRDSNL
jgi:hypothetical protein